MSSPETPTDTTETDAAAAAPEEATAEETVETDERREELLAEITDRLGADAVVASHIDPGHDLWVRVATASWGDVAHVLHHDLGFDYFTFLSAIDWMPSPFGRGMDAEVDTALEAASDEGAAADEAAGPEAIEQGVTGGDTRFQVLGRLYSTHRHLAVTLKADVPADTLTVATWTGTYRGADWHERETWEMYGIVFDGHPHLHHIYLPGDFEGNPLRKDFPLLARMVKPWPGIVDVEPMPETGASDGEASDGEASDEASTDGGEGE